MRYRRSCHAQSIARPRVRAAAAGCSSGTCCRATIACLLAALLACCTPRAAADTFHIQSGIIEGRVVEESATLLTIETEAGILQIPTSAVSRRGKGPTRVEAYERRRAEITFTADSHVDLARWCLDQGLAAQAQLHIDAALDAAPGHRGARALAGYVEVGGVWLLANAPAKAAVVKGTVPARLAETLAAEWHRRVNVLTDELLRRSTDTNVADRARERLLEIRSPLAIAPMCRNLGSAEKDHRRFLIDLLGGFEEDESVMNLCMLALLDPDPRLREQATAQLAHAPGGRVSEFFQAALRCDAERVVRNAAQALGWLGDRSAVGPLIDALVAEERGARRQTSRQLFAELGRLFSTPHRVPVGVEAVSIPPAVQVFDVPRTAEQLAAEPPAAAGSVRSEVQDALILVTGQNFGFDAAAWRDWLMRNPPLSGPVP